MYYLDLITNLPIKRRYIKQIKEADDISSKQFNSLIQQNLFRILLFQHHSCPYVPLLRVRSYGISLRQSKALSDSDVIV